MVLSVLLALLVGVGPQTLQTPDPNRVEDVRISGIRRFPLILTSSTRFGSGVCSVCGPTPTRRASNTDRTIVHSSQVRKFYYKRRKLDSIWRFWFAADYADYADLKSV